MLSNSRVAYQQHDHHRCQSAALARAKTLCERGGARLTPIRETVLRLIWQSHRPLGAYDIIERLSETSGQRVVPPTVYRALDFLLGQGLVHRLATLNAYIGCPFPDNAHSNVFMLCRTCGRVAEYTVEAIDKAIVATAERSGFAIDAQAIEVSGLCPQCRETREVDESSASGGGL